MKYGRQAIRHAIAGLTRGSLHARLVVVFFLFSGLIVGLLGFAGWIFLSGHVRGTVAAQLNATADLCEASLEQWVDEQARLAGAISRLPDLIRLAAAIPVSRETAPQTLGQIEDLFRVIVNGHGEFHEILLLSSTGGRVLCSTNPSRRGEYRTTDSAFVLGRKGLYVQSVHPSPATLLPTMTVAAPVQSSSGALLAVLAVDLELDSMDRLVRVGKALGPSEESYLVDRFHTFVSSERFGRVDYPRGVRSFGIDRATAGGSGSSTYASYRGVQVAGAFRWIAPLELAFLVEVPVSEAFAAVRMQTTRLTVVGLLLVTILAGGVYLIAGRIAGPLVAVQRAAARVAEGKLDTTAPVLTADEIGKLAESFNTMTARLRGMYDEVKLREEHFRSLIEASSDLIIVVDESQRASFVSPSVHRLLGYTPERYVGADPFTAVHPGDHARLRAELQRIFLGADIPAHDVEFRCRDSLGRRHVLAAVGRNMISHPAIKGIVVNARDITERRAAEEENARLEEQLRQVQKMESIGRLAGGIAHDINNLLTPILGYAELLADVVAFSADGREGLEQIAGAALRAQELTRQLLAFGRKQILTLAALDLREVVRGFESLLRRTIRENIRIELRLPPSLGIVEADAGQIEQVLMNLSVNAQDAMPDGGELAIELRDLDVDAARAIAGDVAMGDHVLLSVSDTGRGMDRLVLDRLFEPFFTTKERGKGTGLGLSTAYGIVRQHGGSIAVWSAPGKGTTFHILLPRTSNAAQKEGMSGAPRAPAATGRETILVVEDTPAVRELACRVLERRGYRIINAASGEQAIECAAAFGAPIDLLLTDVVMPGINGKDLYGRLVAIRPGLRVLYMSGYSNEVIAFHGVLERGVSYIQKPFTVEGLARKIRETLDVPHSG